MKILWSHEALQQLNAIEEYIAKDNPQRGVSFVLEIIDHVQQNLPDHPGMGRVVPEIRNPSIRELIYKGHRIIYRHSRNHVQVLTVFEGHRLLRVNDLL